MIELNIVQEQYARMSDEELQLFAMNESDKLTLDSFHLLKAEFEKRNLDLGIIEESKLDQDLRNLNKYNALEDVTTKQFVESLYQYALDQKEEGKSNLEIYNALLNMNIEEKHAYMLVQSLEVTTNKLVENYSTEMTIGWISIVTGFVCFFLAATEKVSGYFILYGILALILGIYRLFKSDSKKEKYQKISENIKNEREQIEKKKDLN